MIDALIIIYAFLTVFFAVLSFGFSRTGKREQLLRQLRTENGERDYRISFLLTQILIQSAFMLVLVLSLTNLYVSFIIATCAAFAPIPIRFVKNRTLRRRLDSQIEPLLINLSSALFVEPSFKHALCEARREAETPMKEEINRVLVEIETGSTQHDALQRMGTRVKDEIIDMAIYGVAICSETGGELASYLNRLAELKRGRRRLVGRIEAMSSQQKTTAKIVAMIPGIFLCMIWLINRSYLQYFVSPAGIVIAAYSVISITAGFITMNRMARLLPEA